MIDRMDDIDKQIGKLMRVVHLLSGISEDTTVESAKTVINQAEDIMNEVDMRDLCQRIDWNEEDYDD